MFIGRLYGEIMKDVFSYNSDTNKTAYLNWRTNLYEPIHNMLVLANGVV